MKSCGIAPHTRSRRTRERRCGLKRAPQTLCCVPSLRLCHQVQDKFGSWDHPAGKVRSRPPAAGPDVELEHPTLAGCGDAMPRGDEDPPTATRSNFSFRRERAAKSFRLRCFPCFFFKCFFMLVSVVFLMGVRGYCVLSLLAGELPGKAARNLCNTNGVDV